MAVYRKLLCIQFHHKYFDVFCDENHRKAFLEVKKQNNVKKYYYPELFDYIYLNSIYNKKSDGILRAKKYSFQQKLLIGGIGIVIGTSFLSLMEDSHTNIHFNNQFLSSTIEIDPKKGLEEEELSSISHQVTLEDCGLSTVSFDDLRKTVDSNPSIDMNSKNDIHIFLNNLEQKEPTSEIRILNENSKTLKIKIIPNNEWTMTGVDGFYNSATNTIHLKEDYESITYRKNVIFHELGHLLNNINLKINNQVTHFNYYHYDDNYGKALSEGFDTVFMNYLLSDNYHTYFDDPYKKIYQL